MSYLDYDKNSILVCKGDARNKKKILLNKQYDNYSEARFKSQMQLLVKQ